VRAALCAARERSGGLASLSHYVSTSSAILLVEDDRLAFELSGSRTKPHGQEYTGFEVDAPRVIL